MSRNFTIQAAASGSFVVPADRTSFIETTVEQFVTHVGVISATTSSMDKIIYLPGGEEIEEMGGQNSLFSLQYGYDDPAVIFWSTGGSAITRTLFSSELYYLVSNPLTLYSENSARNGGVLGTLLNLNVSANTRTVRYLIGTIAETDTRAKVQSSPNAQTLSVSSNAVINIPAGQRLVWIQGNAGSGQGAVRFTPDPDNTVIRYMPKPVEAPRARVFEPAGQHNNLPVLGNNKVTFRIRRNLAAEDETLTAVVRKTIPSTQPAVSVISLDNTNDPVAFRFDRLHEIGKALDGRPFVVTPDRVRFLRNDGSRVTVSANTVVRWNNAELLVVKSAGQVPTRVLNILLNDEYNLAVGVSAPTFSSLWDTAVVQPVSGLTLIENFESMHIYLESVDTAEATVRFRKKGNTVWFAAQPLIYDLRNRSAVTYTYTDENGSVRATNMTESVPGNHRNIICYLRPNTLYEIEVLQNGKIWRNEKSTQGYSRTKVVCPQIVGQVNGDISITRTGTGTSANPFIWTMVRTGTSPIVVSGVGTATFAEFHTGLVRGTITIDAPRVILRDVDVVGSPRSALSFTPRAQAVRIVRGYIASWGASDTVVSSRPENVGWAYRYDSAIMWPNTDSAASNEISFIGVRTGSPRYPANHWEQFNPSTGVEWFPGISAGVTNWRLGYGNHPWGGTFAYNNTGSLKGGISFYDCSFAGSSLRPCEDGIMSSPSGSKTVAGFGPNSVIAYCYVTGCTDDMLELDGMNSNFLVLGNWLRMERGVRRVTGPRAGISVSTGYWGPTVISRNVFEWRIRNLEIDTAGFGGSHLNESGYCFKIKRTDADETGMVVINHNTCLPWRSGYELREGATAFFSNSGSVTRQVILRGCLARILTTNVTPLSGTAVIYTDNDIEGMIRTSAVTGEIVVNTSASLSFEANSAIPISAVSTVTLIPNVNDGGPWGRSIPRAGAA